jgi:hypothetical protein
MGQIINSCWRTKQFYRTAQLIKQLYLQVENIATSLNFASTIGVNVDGISAVGQFLLFNLSARVCAHKIELLLDRCQNKFTSH